MPECPAVLCPGEDWGPLRGFAKWLKATRGQCWECQTAQIIFLETSSSSLLCFKDAWPTLAVMGILRKQNRIPICFLGSSDGIFVPFIHVLLISGPLEVMFSFSLLSPPRGSVRKKCPVTEGSKLGSFTLVASKFSTKAKDYFSGLKIQETFFSLRAGIFWYKLSVQMHNSGTCENFLLFRTQEER